MRIGIDMGGTKIEGILLDEQGREQQRQRIDTPRNDYPATVQAIVDLIKQLESELHEPATVGIGIPGAISPASGRVKNANSTWLIGQPLQNDLQQQLGREIKIENDANCFVVSEATDGAAQGADVVFGVIIGTGTGGGIYVRGNSIVGLNAIAGEWGHNPLPWPTPDEYPGRDCYCGKKGCIETWLSGPGFSRDHQLSGGGHLPAPEIAQLAAQGNTLAEASLERYEQRLAKSLASVINILDPEIIVLGGGMSNIRRLYDNVPKLWTTYVFSDRVDTRLVPPKHGDSSGVRGAAWLWPQ
ncbi:ROK family protein [Thiohalophilus thiocyanatoxydans]|uniref:Fructokinase n=1 Tax=Thiohalophilus thiocyanatoxydans TaxID=381308 RepID=A0A4R8ISM3_9GAMM|nr:ROK family protein [Thiohalophilus thiocyanatoxydans]TDY04051.1 fructokinase [Thiohalophilus thiocyanatoxydans]